jgi:hypothetical protein
MAPRDDVRAARPGPGDAPEPASATTFEPTPSGDGLKRAPDAAIARLARHRFAEIEAAILTSADPTKDRAGGHAAPPGRSRRLSSSESPGKTMGRDISTQRARRWEVRLSVEAAPASRGSSGDLGRACGVAAAAYIAGILSVQLLAGFVLNQHVGLYACVSNRGLWVGLGLVLAYVFLSRRGVAEAAIMTGFWFVFALCVLLLLGFGDDRLQQYGDHNRITRFAREGMTIAKWLAGTALLSWIRDGVTWIPAVRESFEAAPAMATRQSLASFSAFVMIGSTFILLRRWPNRMSVLLPVSTPIWWLFSSGYIEYYPLIASAYLALLIWIFERPFAERSGLWVGVVAATLFPVLYLGFAPIALATAAIYCLDQPRRTPVVLLSAAVAATLGVVVLWPDTFSAYRYQLMTTLNPGEMHLFYQPYAGQSAGPDSIFFKTSFALSSVHLREVLFMVTFGAGLPLLPLGFWGIWKCLSRPFADAEWIRDRRVWLGVAIVTWQLVYLIWMMPKYGPIKDIDLFFVTYISLAFFAGRLLDLQPSLSVGSESRLREPLLASVFGSSAASASMLVIDGLRLPI